jgi:outer membrane protein OmpA-like peptidoglycan-associated protein
VTASNAILIIGLAVLMLPACTEATPEQAATPGVEVERYPEDLDLPTGEVAPLELDFTPVAAPPADTLFAVNSAELLPDAVTELAVVCALLAGTDLEGRQVFVIGHASSEGTVENNEQLSVDRANAVTGWLADPNNCELPLEALVAIGCGARRPLVDDMPDGVLDETAAATNRRVEVVLADPGTPTPCRS